MCNQFLHECTGLMLARGLAEMLELTFSIDSAVDDGNFFEATDDPAAVHCSDANLAWILDAEKNGLSRDSPGARIQKKCHYEQILKVARRSIRDNRQRGSISDDMLFLLFSCLHEFGHATDLLTMNELERNKQTKAREDAKARAEKLFQSKAKMVIASVDIPFSLKSMPFLIGDFRSRNKRILLLLTIWSSCCKLTVLRRN